MEPIVSCWHCIGDVAVRALFCHGCGSIQPPGEVDPFKRLNLPTTFSLDTAAIDRQVVGFARILAPERFVEKGPVAVAHAGAHRRAHAHAATILRDPALRARALLVMADAAPGLPANGGKWEIAVAAAPDSLSRAQVVVEIRDEMASELRLLLDAFRLGDLSLAATRLTRVETMTQAIEVANRLG